MAAAISPAGRSSSSGIQFLLTILKGQGSEAMRSNTSSGEMQLSQPPHAALIRTSDARAYLWDWGSESRIIGAARAE
jgi:hypothetical protein